MLLDAVNKFLSGTDYVLNAVLDILEEVQGSDTDPALEVRVEKVRCTYTSLQERKIKHHEGSGNLEAQQWKRLYVAGEQGGFPEEGILS